jgi:hypothetical protein
MHRWVLRMIVSKIGDEFHAECIDAGALGIGASVWEAVSELATTLLLMAGTAVDEDLELACEPTPEHEQLFSQLERQGPVNDAVRWGRVTIAICTANDAKVDIEEVHLAGAA